LVEWISWLGQYCTVYRLIAYSKLRTWFFYFHSIRLYTNSLHCYWVLQSPELLTFWNGFEFHSDSIILGLSIIESVYFVQEICRTINPDWGNLHARWLPRQIQGSKICLDRGMNTGLPILSQLPKLWAYDEPLLLRNGVASQDVFGHLAGLWSVGLHFVILIIWNDINKECQGSNLRFLFLPAKFVILKNWFWF